MHPIQNHQSREARGLRPRSTRGKGLRDALVLRDEVVPPFAVFHQEMRLQSSQLTHLLTGGSSPQTSEMSSIVQPEIRGTPNNHSLEEASHR